MGEAIYRPGEERKINTRNQATLHCLQPAYEGYGYHPRPLSISTERP
jgi:hypothetical protein